MTRKDFQKIPWATLGRRESHSEVMQKAAEQMSLLPFMGNRPLYSIIVNGAGPDAPLIRSLEAQAYPHWELIVCGSSFATNDSRIRFLPGAISGVGEAFAEALRVVRGDWVGLLSEEDLLSPVALFFFTRDSDADVSKDVWYANEVHVSSDYRRIDRLFSKGAYSWFNLLHFSALGKPWFVKRETLSCLSFDTDDFETDFPLKLSEETENWGHVPMYLVYRKTEEVSDIFHRDGSAACAVNEHLTRKGISGRTVVKAQANVVRPEVNLRQLSVSVIICFHNRSHWTIRCLQSLKNATGSAAVDVLLINNRSMPSERLAVKQAASASGLSFQLIDDDRPFNFGEMNNDAVKRFARGELIFFLNNDVFLKTSGAIDEMAAWAIGDGVGVVGMRLHYPDGRIQHSGFRAIYGGGSRMARVGHAHDDDAFARGRREVFGNTFAACMVKRSLFESLGGLRSIDFPNGFGDVAFNLECHRRGFHNLYLGDIEGVHLESASRGLAYEYWEEVAIEREFSDVLQKMLRADNGFNLVPKPDMSWVQVKESVMGMLYRKSPLLLKMRPLAKRMLGWVRGMEQVLPIKRLVDETG